MTRCGCRVVGFDGERIYALECTYGSPVRTSFCLSEHIWHDPHIRAAMLAQGLRVPVVDVRGRTR